MSVDVESELARLGTAWNESVAHVDVTEVLERTKAGGPQAIDDMFDPIDDMFDPPATRRHRRRIEPRSHRPRQHWLVAATCTVLVVAGVVAMAHRPVGGPEPAATNPATTPVPIDELIAPSPTTSIEPAAATAYRQAVVQRLIDVLNSAEIDDADDLTSVRGLFTEDATIRAFSMREQSSVSETLAPEQWILQLRTWGFNGALRPPCFPSEASDSTVSCSLSASWATLLADAGESWTVEFVGDQIHTLLIESAGRRNEATLPLAVADLADWEQWLRDSDPETATRLVPSVEFGEGPVVTRYDPAVAAEISTSIQTYVDNRPKGDEIRVTADRVEVGEQLVTVGMARTDGRRYVLAGRHQTDRDLEVSIAEQAVLAAFDDVGRELWRTELDGCPGAIAVVDDAVWVGPGGPNCSTSGPGLTRSVTRIDSSDGRELGEVVVDKSWDMVGAFGSLWALDWTGHLVRVAPDLSTTTVEGPFLDFTTDGCDTCPDGLAAGTDAIWVPLGDRGVAVVDAVTNEVTTIPRDEIGHDVLKVAVDGEVTYVASLDRVTSIVDGQVRATVSITDSEFGIVYLGPIDGVIGAQPSGGQFAVLRADDPMVVERRETSGGRWAQHEIDGEAWASVWNGWRPDFHRVGLLTASEGAG